LDEFGGRAYTGSGDDAAVFSDGGGFNDCDVELVVGLVERVEAARDVS